MPRRPLLVSCLHGLHAHAGVSGGCAEIVLHKPLRVVGRVFYTAGMPSDAALREMATARLHRIFAAMEAPEVPRPSVVIPPPSPAEEVARSHHALPARPRRHQGTTR
jgi:hypothetical protein